MMAVNTITVPKSARYAENAQRPASRRDGCTPCVICGKGIREERQTRFLHDVGGGGGVYLHPDSEGEYVSDGADMGFYPVGAECLRDHPEMRPYVTRQGAQDTPAGD